MKAVLFDLYETLVTHFDPNWTPPPRSIAQRLGLDERSYGELWRDFDRAWQIGEIERYEEALTQLCFAAGVKPYASVIEELSLEYRATIARCFDTIEREIVEMAAAFKQNGLKMGVVTNASNLDAAPWPNCLLSPYFDDFVASHRIGLMKPDARMYELACLRLGVDPKEVVFVGDGGANELYGAAQMGMTAYWCTWFLDRWPEGIRPNGFAGDDWRQQSSTEIEPPYSRLSRPEELVQVVLRQVL